MDQYSRARRLRRATGRPAQGRRSASGVATRKLAHRLRADSHRFRTAHGRQADVSFAAVRLLMRRAVVVASLVSLIALQRGGARAERRRRASGRRSARPTPTLVDAAATSRVAAAARSRFRRASRERTRRSHRSLIPGAGQFMLGNDRFVGYLAVEALAWWKYAKDISERRGAGARSSKNSRATSRARISRRTGLLRTRTGRTTSGCATSRERRRISLTTTGPVVPETDHDDVQRDAMGAGCRARYPTRAAALAQYEQDRDQARSSGGRGTSAQLRVRHLQADTDKRNDANRAAVRRTCSSSARIISEHGRRVHHGATCRCEPDRERTNARSARACAGEPNHSGLEACNCCSYHKLTSLQTPPYYGASPLTSSRREWPRQARSCTRPMASLRRMSCSGGSTALGFRS